MSYTIGGAPQTIGSTRFQSVITAELALTAWRYGKDYGSHQAMVLIAHTIANRYRRGWGPFLQIIQSIPRYSSTLEQPMGYPDSWDRSFLKLLTDIDAIVEGTAKDPTNGSLFWADLAKIDNPWFLTNICRNPEHARVADMNSLTFFS
jgi:hypothetical protein